MAKKVKSASLKQIIVNHYGELFTCSNGSTILTAIHIILTLQLIDLQQAFNSISDTNNIASILSLSP